MLDWDYRSSVLEARGADVVTVLRSYIHDIGLLITRYHNDAQIHDSIERTIYLVSMCRPYTHLPHECTEKIRRS
jgi:hypothetical protein